MNCSSARDLLSAYHDDEVSSDVRAEISRHLETCPGCSEELRQFAKISLLASQLEQPAAPAGIWREIGTVLDARRERPLVALWDRKALRRLAIAAAALLVLGVGLFAVFRSQDEAHAEASIDLAPFARTFQRDPNRAQRDLLAQYSSQAVSLEQAEKRLGYRPAVVDVLPEGLALEELRLIDMPCCTCVQAIYDQDGSSPLVTFQQHADEPLAFDGCAQIVCQCGETEARIAQVDGQIAATWRIAGTYVTLVGARNLEQVIATITALDFQAAASEP